VALLLTAGFVTAQDTEWETAIGQNDQVTKGLVSYWSMRNSGTTVFDEVGTNTGTAAGSPTFAVANGIVGQGVSLTGTPQYISMSAPVVASSKTVTVGMWIKPSAIGSAVLFASGGTTTSDQLFNFQMSATGVLRFDRFLPSGGYVDGTITIATNAWSHVVCTLNDDANTVTLSVNGVTETLAYTETYGGTQAYYGGIGVIRLGGTNYTHFAGSIDEVRHYNRVLTSDEIKQLYRMGKVINQNR
jgi:hypothetical protein